MDKDSTVKITKNLLRLERGENELLLVNCLNPRPLYIKKGRQYISDFLKSASELGSYNRIINHYPDDVNLLELLLTHEIIIPAGSEKENIPYRKLSETLVLKNRRNTSLYLLLSQSCNMGCVYCLNGIKTYRKEKNLMMSRDVAFQSIDRCLADIRPGGFLEVIFFGGEPMLNWPLAKEIITCCENSLKAKHHERQIKYHFTSNLSIIPDDLNAWAKKYNITFLCDIDGPEPVHNNCRPFKGGRPSYGPIVSNIRRLVDDGLKVSLRATITALNEDYLAQIAGHHRAIGGSSCAFVPVNPVNSDEDILSEEMLPSPDKIIEGLIKVYSDRIWRPEDLYPFNQYWSRFARGSRMAVGCGAPYGNTPVVDINGDVYPCIYLVGIQKFYMGNMMNGTYPDEGLLDWMYDLLHVDRTAECKSCPWRYLCGGGCPVGRLTVLSNSSAGKEVTAYCEQIRCEYTRKLMESVLWDKARETASGILERYSEDETMDTTIHC